MIYMYGSFDGRQNQQPQVIRTLALRGQSKNIISKLCTDTKLIISSFPIPETSSQRLWMPNSEAMQCQVIRCFASYVVGIWFS